MVDEPFELILGQVALKHPIHSNVVNVFAPTNLDTTWPFNMDVMKKGGHPEEQPPLRRT